jgi:hypothetical protein
MLNVAFGNRYWEERKLCVVFLKPKNGAISAEDVGCSEHESNSRILKIWIKCRNVSSKTQASLPVKLLTCLEVHLRESRDFSKTA